MAEVKYADGDHTNEKQKKIHDMINHIHRIILKL